MAEWLGRGLQNLVQRFESASDLKRYQKWWRFFVRYSPVGYLPRVYPYHLRYTKQKKQR